MIKNCSAPCVGRISREAYGERVKQACEFLEGKTQEMREDLKAAMKKAAERRDFEKAGLVTKSGGGSEENDPAGKKVFPGSANDGGSRARFGDSAGRFGVDSSSGTYLSVSTFRTFPTRIVWPRWWCFGMGGPPGLRIGGIGFRGSRVRMMWGVWRR